MNKFQFLKVFMVALVALVTLGCGDSNNDFIGTNNNFIGNSNDFIGTNPNNPDAVGGLLLQFHRGEASHQQPSNVSTELEGVVPANTDHLGFTFYSDRDSSGVYTGPWTDWSNTSFYFSAGADLSVSIANVPGTIHYAIVTAYDANGIPLGALYSPKFNVVDGYSDLPVALSGSDLFQNYSVQELTVADVNIDVTGTFIDTPITATANLAVSATFGDGSTQASAPVPYSLLDNSVTVADPAVASYANGVFTSALGVVDGASTAFTVVYGGVSKTAALTITDGTEYSIDTVFFAGGTADDHEGEPIELAAGATYDLQFDVTYSNGTTATIGFADLKAVGYTLDLLSTGDGVVTINTDGSVTMAEEANDDKGDGVELRDSHGDLASYVWVGGPNS